MRPDADHDRVPQDGASQDAGGQDRHFERLLDAAVSRARAESPGRAETRLLLGQVRSRLNLERPRQPSPVRWWSLAAIIPLLVALAGAYAFWEGGDPPLDAADVAVVENLEVLELLEAVASEEETVDPQDLDPATMVKLLENLELLEELDPEILEGSDETG